MKPALVQVLKISCSVTRWVRKNKKVFLTPQLQYFGHVMWTTDSLEKILMLGKIEDRRRRGQQRIRRLDDLNDSMDMNLRKLWESEGQGSLACCSPWGRKELDMAEQLNNSSYKLGSSAERVFSFVSCLCACFVWFFFFNCRSSQKTSIS